MRIVKNIEVRPINLLGIVGLFFYILFAEMALGSVFYSQAVKYYGANLHLASLIVNGGLVLTKGLILLSLVRLVFYKTTPTEEPSTSTWHWQNALKITAFLGLIVLLYRMAFDSLLSLLLLRWFGHSGDLNWSMYLILGAPVLGYAYILIIAPIFEEVVYRGIFYSGLRKHGDNFWISAVTSALLFAIMHFNVVQGVNAFVLGLLAAFIYEQTQSLIAPIVFHIINNVYVTFFSSVIMGIQWLDTPLRILIMCGSTCLLLILLKKWENKRATL